MSVNKLAGDTKVNPKDFYRYTNSQRKDIQGIPPLKRRNGSDLAESETERAEEFNGQFLDVISKTSESRSLYLRSQPMSDIHVSNGVIKRMKGLNPSKALGPDELHPRVLKELAVELDPVLAHLFQQSLDKGKIPKEWPLANICPLCKKGDRALSTNYRPMSLKCSLWQAVLLFIKQNRYLIYYIRYLI